MEEFTSLECLKADILRSTGSSSRSSIIKHFFINRTVRPVITMRMCQHYKEKKGIFAKIPFALYRILHKVTCQLAGVDLSWKTKIGPGFCITHGWGLVISPGAVIGSNVTLFHGVTIGMKLRELSNGELEKTYPTIGDNVWIGANSVIVGEVTVGEGSVIAPLSMIIKDVEAHVTVGGNPQKVLKKHVNQDRRILP